MCSGVIECEVIAFLQIYKFSSWLIYGDVIYGRCNDVFVVPCLNNNKMNLSGLGKPFFD